MPHAQCVDPSDRRPENMHPIQQTLAPKNNLLDMVHIYHFPNMFPPDTVRMRLPGRSEHNPARTVRTFHLFPRSHLDTVHTRYVLRSVVCRPDTVRMNYLSRLHSPYTVHRCCLSGSNHNRPYMWPFLSGKPKALHYTHRCRNTMRHCLDWFHMCTMSNSQGTRVLCMAFRNHDSIVTDL